MAISALAIFDLVLPGRHGFGVHSDGGLLERIFLALELLWFLLVALRLTQGQPSRACAPAATGPAAPPGQPKASRRDPDPPGTGHQRLVAAGVRVLRQPRREPWGLGSAVPLTAGAGQPRVHNDPMIPAWPCSGRPIPARADATPVRAMLFTAPAKA